MLITKPAIAALALSLALTLPSLARLGDTPDQCNQRYGAKYTEKGGDGFWTAERVYEVNGIRLTLRFLPATNGTTKAAYIDYKPIRGKMSDVQIQTLLETVAKNWAPLTELREEKSNSPKPAAESGLTGHHTKKVTTIESKGDIERRKKLKEEKERQDVQMALATKNKLIKDTQERIRNAVEWYEPRTSETLNIWTTPNAFAGSSPQRVVIFASEYLKQHEKGAETKAGDHSTPHPIEPSEFKGF